MPGYLPPGGYGDPSNNPDFDLTTRPAMFPFLGQYTNRDTGENQFGPAWPTAVTEPLNALMRLIQNSRFEDGRLGIPNPQNIENQHDVTTLIESLTGGNATRGMGAVERGSAEAAVPISHGSVISGAEKGSGKYYSLLRDEPDLTVPSQAPFAGNEGINRLAYDILDRNGDDAGRAELAIDPSKGQAYIDNITLGGNQHGTAGMRDLINSLRALHPEIRSVYGDRTSGARAGSANPRQSIDLFSDNLPSLPGAVIAGAEKSQPGNVRRWTNADGLDNWLSESPHGSVHAWHDPDTNALRIVGAEVNEASRGQGHGLDLYRQLIDEAQRNNIPVISDASISPAAQHIYPALSRRGYTIEPNPRSYVDSTGSLLSPDLNDTLQGGHFIRPPGYTGPAFYSDQLPSLWGSALQGQDQPYPNSLFGY